MADQEASKEIRRLIRSSLMVSQVLCLAAASLPVLATIGWMFNIDLLERVHPSLPAMRPNTAFGLFLAAAAIFLTGDKRVAGKGTVTACLMALIVALFGILTLSEYVFAWDLGIDHFLIGGAAVAEHFPGRPSPQTSANLAVLGASVLAYNVPRLPIRLGQTGALMAAVNAIVVITGYIFNPRGFYGFPSLGADVGMPVPTAASFVLMSLSLLFSRPGAGMMSLIVSDTRSGVMARKILITVVLAPPLIGLLTRIGVIENWYDVSVQVSLFVVVIVVLILRTTWQASRQSEAGERLARAAFDESRIANERLKRVEKEQRFLATVGAILTSTLDYEDTLKNIAQLAVRDLADFCIVDAIDDDGVIRRLKVMSMDPSKAPVCDLFKKVPLDRSRPYLVKAVLDSRRPVLIERLSPAVVAQFAQSTEDLLALQAAGGKSAIAVPLMAHGKMVGIIALVSSSDERIYGLSDVRLAEQMAQRAALSFVNARLFGEVQRAAKTREDVLAIVSHDLKNPVATISLIGHLLRQSEGLDTPKARDFADKIQRSADRMQSLIADLLDFAKMQGGTFSVTAKADALSHVVLPVVDGFRVLAEAKAIKFDLNLPLSLPEVCIDAHRITQVMSNLLGNAIKFTPERGTIRISAQQEGHAVVVTVSDTGPGIPPEHLSKVFDWFWQAQGTKQAGTGLGLFIAKGIVDAHGGTIWVESEVGKGSSFFFTVPVCGLDFTSTPTAA
jgi:signal transduction histidine kinase